MTNLASSGTEHHSFSRDHNRREHQVGDAVRPFGDVLQAALEAPERNNWIRAGEAAARAMTKLKRVDNEPGRVERLARPIVKNVLVSAAQRGVIPGRWILKTIGSRKMMGA